MEIFKPGKQNNNNTYTYSITCSEKQHSKFLAAPQEKQSHEIEFKDKTMKRNSNRTIARLNIKWCSVNRNLNLLHLDFNGISAQRNKFRTDFLCMKIISNVSRQRTKPVYFLHSWFCVVVFQLSQKPRNSYLLCVCINSSRSMIFINKDRSSMKEFRWNRTTQKYVENRGK